MPPSLQHTSPALDIGARWAAKLVACRLNQYLIPLRQLRPHAYQRSPNMDHVKELAQSMRDSRTLKYQYPLDVVLDDDSAVPQDLHPMQSLPARATASVLRGQHRHLAFMLMLRQEIQNANPQDYSTVDDVPDEVVWADPRASWPCVVYSQALSEEENAKDLAQWILADNQTLLRLEASIIDTWTIHSQTPAHDGIAQLYAANHRHMAHCLWHPSLKRVIDTFATSPILCDWITKNTFAVLSSSGTQGIWAAVLQESIQSFRRFPIPLENLTRAILYGTNHAKTKAQPIVPIANLEFFRGRMDAIPKLWSEFGAEPNNLQDINTLYLASLERDASFETLLRARGSHGLIPDMVMDPKILIGIAEPYVKTFTQVLSLLLMLVVAPGDRRKYALQYYPRSANALHPFDSDSHTLNLVWEDVIQRLCTSGIARPDTTYTEIFQYVASRFDNLKTYIGWFGEGALRNLNRTSKGGQELPSLEAVHQQPGSGSGPAAAPGEMDNGHLGIQLCSDSQEWYTLVRDFFVPHEQMEPATPGSPRIFRLASGIPIDLSEDPNARHERLATLQEIHDENVDAESEKHAAIADMIEKLDDARRQKEQAEGIIQDIFGDPDFNELAADHMYGPSPETRLQAVQPTQPRHRAIVTRIAQSSKSKRQYWRNDDPAYQAHKIIRDAPMPNVPSLSPTPDANCNVDSALWNDDENTGDAAASIAINAISSSNMISAIDLELVRPLMQQVLRPDYLRALGAGHTQLPIVPPFIEEELVPRSPSPESSLMMGSQILNKGRNAEEIQGRLPSVKKKRAQRRLDDNDAGDNTKSTSTRKKRKRQQSDDSDEPRDRNQIRRRQKPTSARRAKGRPSRAQVHAVSPPRPADTTIAPTPSLQRGESRNISNDRPLSMPLASQRSSPSPFGTPARYQQSQSPVDDGSPLDRPRSPRACYAVHEEATTPSFDRMRNITTYPRRRSMHAEPLFWSPTYHTTPWSSPTSSESGRRSPAAFEPPWATNIRRQPREQEWPGSDAIASSQEEGNWGGYQHDGGNDSDHQTQEDDAGVTGEESQDERGQTFDNGGEFPDHNAIDDTVAQHADMGIEDDDYPADWDDTIDQMLNDPTILQALNTPVPNA